MKKIKNLFAVLIASVMVGGFLGFGVAHSMEVVANAEEEIEEIITPEGEEEIVTPSPCTVVVKEYDNGELIVDILEGEVGAVATVYPNALPMFTATKVIANGVELVADEEGKYHFELIEGENTVEAVFEVEQSKLEEILDLVKTLSKKKAGELLTTENLMKLIGYGIDVILAVALSVVLLKCKNIKSKTMEEIIATVKTINETEIAKGIQEKMEKELGPYFAKVGLSMNEIKDTCSTMARCMVLSQENTPEARLAIIQELSKNNKKAEEVSQAVTELVKEQKDESEKAKVEQQELLQKLEEQNKTLVETETNIEGRI